MKFEQLRPHQQKAVSLLRSKWKQHRTHLIYAPTGAGKTAIAAYLTRAMAEAGKRVLFIAPYVTLINQTIERFQQYGLPDCGVIWRDHPDYNPGARIQVASADTLVRREFPKNIDLVLVDECHIKRIKLLSIFDELDCHIVGLSGTPFCNWLGKHYDNLIKPTSMTELIKNGYLSDFEVFAPTKPDLSGVKTRKSSEYDDDYIEKELEEIMNGAKVVGNIVQNWLENGENRQTIAFCLNVAHANHIANEFDKAGISCAVVTSKTPLDQRAEIFKDYEQGLVKVLCNVGVLVAGFDSDVRCIIYARPTKSSIRWVQCIGRGLRTAEGKDHCLIFDHSGTVHRLGYPTDCEIDELSSEDDGLSKAEKIKKEIEKLEKAPKECPKCHYLKPVGQLMCPKCGFEPRFGEDVETDETRQIKKLKSAIENTKQEKADNVTKQEFYSQLMGLKREHKALGKQKKDGYYAHLYKAKFGVWPRSLSNSEKPAGIEVRNFEISQRIKRAKSRYIK